MNYLLTPLLLFLTFSCAVKNNEKVEDDLSVKIVLVREYDVPYREELKYEPENDSIIEKRFDIRISLINNTNNAISIWLMTCDWQRNFSINNNYISLKWPDGCDHNFPETFTINAKDSLTFQATLLRDIRVDNPCKNCIGYDSGHVETTKVGFLMIDTIQCKNNNEYFNVMEDRSKWKEIIWSNPLFLRK